MNDPNREAFEVAADLIGFRTDKINDSYIMLTQRAWRVWQAAKSHAAQECEGSYRRTDMINGIAQR